MIRRIIVLLLSMALGVVAYGDYLWWTIKDDPTVNYTFNDDELQCKTDNFWLNDNGNRLEVTDVRVHVVGTGVDEYLNIMATGDTKAWPSVSFDELPIIMSGNNAFAFDMAPYMSNPASYSFIVELGNWDNTFPNEDGWTKMAEHYIPSGSVAQHVTESMTTPPTAGMYKVNEFNAVAGAVPEPTSGMLVLMGFSFLVLRRRRRS